MALHLSSSRVVAYRFTYVYTAPPPMVKPPPESETKPVTPPPGTIPPGTTKPAEPPLRHGQLPTDPDVGVDNTLPSEEVEDEVVTLPEDSIVLATSTFPDDGFPSFKLNDEDVDTSGDLVFSKKDVLFRSEKGVVKIKFTRADCENGKGVRGYILVIPKYG